jgi:hypothetical protein
VIKLSNMPEDVITHYHLLNIKTPNGYVYCKIHQGMYALPQARIIVQELLAKMFNVFLINYPGLTKYSIEQDGGVNNASKKDIVKGRHSFCLFYPDGWQEQLQLSDISAELQISRYLTDEHHYQPNRLGKIMDIQGKDVN